MIFSNYPPSVKFLFGLRNRLATLFGLKSSEGFHNYISEQIVKFHNQMGKIYFLLIKRVHGLLCRMALNRVVKAVKTTEEKINGSNENS